MIRTIVSILKKDKDWLEKQAKKENITMAELIRRSITHYQQCHSVVTHSASDDIIQKTKGLWSGKQDGLDYQNSIRKEWEPDE